MGKEIDAEGYEIEVLGTCQTNPRQASQHQQNVEARHLWSYAQEEALVAVSELGKDKCWHLIDDPERRAKRIAARYADLYFKSAEKSRGKLQLYWPALAAFVVKDIVEAFSYSREKVLKAGWRNALRTSSPSSVVSSVFTDASPYEHALRVYVALAKGNLWLFQDIYPWLWFVLEYGLSKDGSLNEALLRNDVGQRDASTLQAQSKSALEQLPFGAAWLGRLQGRMAADPVWEQASKYFDAMPAWTGPDGGYGATVANAAMAHKHVQGSIKSYDKGYHLPTSSYWTSFPEAFYVMDEERRELSRVAKDAAATQRLRSVAQFKVTDEIKNAYAIFASEYKAKNKKAAFDFQKRELVEIAKQEQLNVLQPLIYEDKLLGKTMGINHAISRYSGGFLSPRYAVVYSARPHVEDPQLQTVFDQPDGALDYLTGPKKSLPDKKDRMSYVDQIARDFNGLMDRNRTYMEGELRKIQGWLNA